MEKPSFLEEDAKAFLAEPDHQENTEFGWKRRDERMVVLGRQSSIRRDRYGGMITRLLEWDIYCRQEWKIRVKLP